MSGVRSVWCVQCNRDVDARLVTGRDIYPRERHKELWEQPFYRCPHCAGHVGTHHKHVKEGQDPAPLGCIPTPALRDARRHIHAILDPLWKGDPPLYRRPSIYAEVSRRIGVPFHTSEIRSVDDARAVWRVVKAIARAADAGGHPYRLLAAVDPAQHITWRGKRELAPAQLLALTPTTGETNARTDAA